MKLELNEALRAFRKERGWSLEDMGKKLHVSRQAVYYYETGRNKPSLDTLYLYFKNGFVYDFADGEYRQ